MKQDKATPHLQPKCECAICALKLDFELDAHLVSEIEKHNCVIFAGSGISTETDGAHPNTLYRTLECHVDAPENMEFWELVDKFESQPNGRQKFIELVKERFEYIDSFRDLKWAATRFHRSLGGAPYFDTIITTNWDRYFEDIIKATPFVYDSDIPFWGNAKRPVLKIHGSIDNYSSLIASTDDYNSCEERLREGSLGAVLKQIFSTKTCILCGFSAKDKDFIRIFSTIKEGLGQFARTHYLVSPFITDDEEQSLKDKLGIVSIRTDGSHFLDVVKSHMQEKFCFASDESFIKIESTLLYFREMHFQFVASYNPKKSPHIIYATSYQDGVIHALERILDRALTGEFSDLHRVQRLVAGYDAKIKECSKSKNYWDLAYFCGYQNGILSLLIANEKVEVGSDEIDIDVPECYHPGQGEMYLDDYNRIVRPNSDIHKGALSQAKKKTARFAEDDGLVVQHMPWG